jgi:hypothetical protein
MHNDWPADDTAIGATAQRRNPFGVMDVPSPDDAEVETFAATAELFGDANDVNAGAWHVALEIGDAGDSHGLDGRWAGRWNGGQDPSIAGDSPQAWKAGPAQVKTAAGRVYLLFAWDDRRRRGLIEARRDHARLIGRYVNLSDPAITRPWVGLIVSERRIDGRWPGGRLDFRR